LAIGSLDTWSPSAWLVLRRGSDRRVGSLAAARAARTNRLTSTTLAVTAVLAVSALLGSRALFRRGLRQYSGASA
jgi:hypothetical protein